MKRCKIMQGGNDNGWVFVSSKLPETLQLCVGRWHEVFLSCVMLQLFIHSVQLANAKAMRIHTRLVYTRARTFAALKPLPLTLSAVSPARAAAALAELQRIYPPHGGMTCPFAKANRNIVSSCWKSNNSTRGAQAEGSQVCRVKWPPPKADC